MYTSRTRHGVARIDRASWRKLGGRGERKASVEWSGVVCCVAFYPAFTLRPGKKLEARGIRVFTLLAILRLGEPRFSSGLQFFESIKWATTTLFDMAL